MTCAYCGVRRAGNRDHVIPKSVLARAVRDATLGVRAKDPLKNAPNWLQETVASCFQCNMRKGTRRLCPPSWRHRLRRLNALGLGTFQVWDGGKLPEVIR